MGAALRGEARARADGVARAVRLLLAAGGAPGVHAVPAGQVPADARGLGLQVRSGAPGVICCLTEGANNVPVRSRTSCAFSSLLELLAAQCRHCDFVVDSTVTQTRLCRQSRLCRTPAHELSAPPTSVG